MRYGYIKLSVALGIVLLSSMSYSTGSNLLIFGGPGNSQFLGCFDCRSTNRTSITYQNGDYSSDQSPYSLFNNNGLYSDPNSDYSACNIEANHPPILVNQDGAVFGHISKNDRLITSLRGTQFTKLLSQICA
jgi:hypothetical protein